VPARIFILNYILTTFTGTVLQSGMTFIAVLFHSLPSDTLARLRSSFNPSLRTLQEVMRLEA
jgi:hypothetical protein